MDPGQDWVSTDCQATKIGAASAIPGGIWVWIAETEQSDHLVWIQWWLNLPQEGSVSGLVHFSEWKVQSSGARKVKRSLEEGQWRRWEEWTGDGLEGDQCDWGVQGKGIGGIFFTWPYLCYCFRTPKICLWMESWERAGAPQQCPWWQSGAMHK